MTTSAGHAHAVTPISRPKTGFGIIAVGTATTSTVTTAATDAVMYRRTGQVRSAAAAAESVVAIRDRGPRVGVDIPRRVYPCRVVDHPGFRSTVGA